MFIIMLPNVTALTRLPMIGLNKFEGAGILSKPNIVGDIVSGMQFGFLPLIMTNL